MWIRIGEMVKTGDIEGLLQEFQKTGDWDSRETVVVAMRNMVWEKRPFDQSRLKDALTSMSRCAPLEPMLAPPNDPRQILSLLENPVGSHTSSCSLSASETPVQCAPTHKPARSAFCADPAFRKGVSV